MALPFGKTIKTRHFTVLKFSKSLSKKEVASLREDIPADVKKHLQRGSLPFIKIEDITILIKFLRSNQTQNIGLRRFIHGRLRPHTRLRMMLGSF